MREMENDGALYTQAIKNKLYISGIRYARIKVSAAFIRYYAPDEATLKRVLRVVGHKEDGE